MLYIQQKQGRIIIITIIIHIIISCEGPDIQACPRCLIAEIRTQIQVWAAFAVAIPRFRIAMRGKLCQKLVWYSAALFFGSCICLVSVSAWSSRDLMPETRNKVADNEETLQKLVEHPVPCDTKFECKRRTYFGKKKMKCQICPSQLYIVSSKFYEADKDTEKSPYASKDNFPGDDDGASGPSGGTGPAASSTSNVTSAKPSGPSGGTGSDTSSKCQKKEDDTFILPCCVPETNEDNSLVIVPPNTVPSGGLQCCGGGPACCRWCSEYLCDSLEQSNEVLPGLWWHVCNDKDIEETTSKRFQNDINDKKRPPSLQKLLRDGRKQ